MTCALDGTPRGDAVNALLGEGRTPHWVENQMRAEGTPVKAETVRKHRDVCLRQAVEKAAMDMSNPDFAHAVRATAQQMLNEGRLTVTAAHGLKAQELIDRREARAADRSLMIELAGLLSGARTMGPPPDLIEAEWHEVSDPDASPPLLTVADGS